MIDVAQYIGESFDVTVDAGANVRTMTVTVGDGGPLQTEDGRRIWDGRQVLALTVQFTDGRRSHWASADAGAGKVAEKLLAPYSVGVLGQGDGWEARIDRSQRDQGKRRNGSTRFTFYVFPAPSRADLDREREATRQRLAAVAARLGMSV